MNAQLPFYAAASSQPILQTWSLRSAELQYIGRHGETRFHSFSLLVDDSAPRGAVVLDELHFIPVIRRADGSVIRATRARRRKAERLGAAAYRPAGRSLTMLPNISYDRGQPLEMLKHWNAACRVALQIASLERPFDDVYNCRSGTRTVIERLGYTFRTFADPAMQLGMNSPLPAELAQASPVHYTPDPAMDYQQLRQLLTLPRGESLKPA